MALRPRIAPPRSPMLRPCPGHIRRERSHAAAARDCAQRAARGGGALPDVVGIKQKQNPAQNVNKPPYVCARLVDTRSQPHGAQSSALSGSGPRRAWMSVSFCEAEPGAASATKRDSPVAIVLMDRSWLLWCIATHRRRCGASDMRVASAAANKAQAGDIHSYFRAWVSLAAMMMAQHATSHAIGAAPYPTSSELAWQQMAERLLFFHRMSTSLEQLSQPSLLASMIRSVSERTETMSTTETTDQIAPAAGSVETADQPSDASPLAATEADEAVLDPFDDFERAKLQAPSPRSRLRLEAETSVMQRRKGVLDVVRTIETSNTMQPEAQAVPYTRRAQPAKGIGANESTRTSQHAGDSTLKDAVRRTLSYPS